MDAKKVAYVVYWFPKPSETFVFGEVLELMGLGLDVEVHTLYGPWRGELGPAMAGFKGPVRRLGVRALPGIAAALWVWLRRDPAALRRTLAQVLFRRWRSPETRLEAWWAGLCSFRLALDFEARGVTHAHADWADGAATAAWLAARLAGIPFSFTGRAHDLYPPDGALADKARDCAFVRVDVAENQRYLAGLGVDRAKIRLVYAALTMIDPALAEPGFEPPFRLLAIGRFVDKKGFDVLLEACARLMGRGLDFRLTLAGDGPLRSRLVSRAAALGLGDRVLFPGFVGHDKVPGLLLAADVFVMPCRVSASGDRDGIPNAVLEAMAHGLPVVASNVSGLSEVVVDRVTGRLVPEKDPAALAQALTEVLADRKSALDMAGRARDMVLARFDRAARARDLLGLFMEDIKGP
ncbi:MAG: glycosyltransferase family 4 protein [Desulfovibrionaceae bacterium]|nr:glycosyltransferase family 4 protein [Desulfovibrionaceae bacterium]